MMTRHQVVRNNRAWANSDHGIMLRTIQDSVVEGNVVADNARGFFVYDAEYNTIRNNLVVGNHVGVHLWPAPSTTRWTATTSSPTASRCASWPPGRIVGCQGGQPLEQLSWLGPGRRRPR